jgi:hypothetical protein
MQMVPQRGSPVNGLGRPGEGRSAAKSRKLQESGSRERMSVPGDEDSDESGRQEELSSGRRRGQRQCTAARRLRATWPRRFRSRARLTPRVSRPNGTPAGGGVKLLFYVPSNTPAAHAVLFFASSEGTYRRLTEIVRAEQHCCAFLNHGSGCLGRPPTTFNRGACGRSAGCPGNLVAVFDSSSEPGARR